MKHPIRIFLTLLFCWSLNSDASLSNDGFGGKPLQIDDTAYIAAETNTDEGRPFTLSFSGDWIAKTKAKRQHHRHDSFIKHHFQYGEAFADLGMIFYYNKCHKEGLAATLEYSYTNFDLKFNPYFRQKNFNTASLSIGGYTERFHRWQVKSQVAINVDANTWNFSEYLTWDIVLWGRYQYSKNLGVHIGFLAETGMKIDHVYPIFGVDWQATKKIKLNLVFPADIAAIYQLNCNWAIALEGRLFSSRHRTSKHAWVPKSLFYYRSSGAEVALTYDNNTWLLASVHAGYTFSGKITLADRHYKHKSHYDVDAAGYAGGEIAFKF